MTTFKINSPMSAVTLAVAASVAFPAWSQLVSEDDIVADLDLSECVNSPEELSTDICIISPGASGVGKVVFDAPVRRVIGGVNANSRATAPRAVLGLEADGSVPANGTVDIVVLAAEGVWLVANSTPVANHVDIYDPKLDPQGNASLVLPIGSFSTGSDPLATGVGATMNRVDADGDGQQEILAWIGDDSALRVIDPASSWLVTQPYSLPAGKSISDIVDLHVADMDGDGTDEAIVLFGDKPQSFAVVTADDPLPTALISIADGMQVVTSIDLDDEVVFVRALVFGEPGVAVLPKEAPPHLGDGLKMG